MEKFEPRRQPPHGRPTWVSPNDSLFITFNTVPRGVNQLAQHRAWDALQSASLHLQASGRWSPSLILVMPDHVHIMARVAPCVSLEKAVGSLKRAVTHACGVRWQRGFFDHRPRHAKACEEKRHYILMNPVRAGLVADPDDWPFRWKRPTGSG